MGRDAGKAIGAAVGYVISTHAPLWGATAIPVFGAAETRFQPTRPYGARQYFRHTFRSNARFQPTRPYGARQEVDACRRAHEISTHAPLWGATACRPRWRATLRNFNPRAPMGRDRRRAQRRVFRPAFQPTRPYGARPSRSPMTGSTDAISTHAPLWGATARAVEQGAVAFRISTHAPLWGATKRYSLWRQMRIGFQPTRPYGARRRTLTLPTKREAFQPTRPYGARPCRARKRCRCR